MFEEVWRNVKDTSNLKTVSTSSLKRLEFHVEFQLLSYGI